MLLRWQGVQSVYLVDNSPLPDLDGEVFAEFVQAVLETSQGGQIRGPEPAEGRSFQFPVVSGQNRKKTSHRSMQPERSGTEAW